MITEVSTQIAGLGPGGADTSVPTLVATTDSVNPLVGITGVTTATWTFTLNKTPFNFVIGDLTLTNCTASNFSIVGLTCTVTLTPSSNGLFGAKVLAAKYQDSRGTDNSASNDLQITFSDASGFTYDLQNATITKSKHYRGHVATFSDCSDETTSSNMYGGEMLMSKYNLASTMNSAGTSSFNQGFYSFGRLDFGNWILGSGTVGTGNYTTVDPLNTTNRSGVQTCCGSYKNGVDSYKANLIPLMLYMRNSTYESFNQTLPTTYSGLSDADMISRGSTFRWDYYAVTTGTDYYVSDQATGDTRLASYVATVISGTGWYTNFTHWAWWIADYPDHYFTQLIAAIGANDVFRCTNNMAVEYYWCKESVTSTVGLGSLVTVNYGKVYSGSPYNEIHTHLWVKFDLTGTGYAGHDITTDNALQKIRSMGSNVFYISVPMDFTQTSTTFHIYITASPNYINLAVPVAGRSGNTITIDQACRKRLYRRLKPTTLTTSVTSTAIPTVDGYTGTINMTGGTGLTVAVDATLRIYNDATHWFYATVVSYTSGTGVFVLHTSGFQGSGSFSSWTIQNYVHYKDTTLVESDYTLTTSHVILATLDLTNYSYQEAVINAEGISSVLEF